MRQWTRELRFWASVWDCSFYLRAVRSARGLPAWASFREGYLRYRSIPDLRFRIWVGIH